MSVRVRFSPAPTGYLHVGSARTALFNWLFARQQGGEFLIRVEDTDVERSRPELIEAIFEALRWLGLDWDGDPLRQSTRLEAHRQAAFDLVERGRAYWCDCSAEAVQQRAKERGGPPGYDGHCRDRGVAQGPDTALRFRTPDEGATSFTDVIRGEVSVDNATIEDFVVLRSSGAPMFVLANALDDVEMEITHVVRGEDLLSATPRAILIRQALEVGYQPVFAHLPMLVNEKRQKLSKRRDDVYLGDYRERGFLPEALVNYLALLGWGPPDGVEVRPLEEIVDLFRLEDVTPSPAFFDVQKLTHVNGEKIRALPVGEFVDRARPYLERGPWKAEAFDDAAFRRLAPVVQERTHLMTDVVDMVDFVFLDEPPLVDDDWSKAIRNLPAAALLDDTIAAFESASWDAAELHRLLQEVGERHGLKLGKAQAPVRVAVTGRRVGPPLFEALEVLGRERTLGRLRSGRQRLG